MIAALNIGWRRAAGEFIARLDSDDLSMPDRLSRQVAFLESHPSVGACGTWTQIIGNTKSGVWHYSCTAAEIRCQLLFGSPMVHSSVMFRRALLEQVGGYDPNFPVALDYDLWTRLAQVTEFANLPEILTTYRVHSTSISRIKRNQLPAMVDRIWLAQLARLSLTPTEAELAAHRAVSIQRFEPAQPLIVAIEIWLGRLGRANQALGLYPEPAFSQELAQRWYSACQRAAGLGPWTFLGFLRSPLTRPLNLPTIELVRLGWACLKGMPPDGSHIAMIDSSAVNLSVVVRTNNRAGFLARVLDSLCGQASPVAFDIVVMDNGSPDTPSGVWRVCQALFRSALLSGTASGSIDCPQSGQAARGEYVAYIDDCRAPPGCAAAEGY